MSTSIVEPVFAWLTARAIGVRVWTFVGAFRGVALAAAGCGVAALFARRALTEAGVAPAARFALAVAVGAAVYAAFVTVFAPEVRAELSRLRRGRRQTRAYEAATTSIAATSGSSTGP
jgi:hypothetical protein